MEELPSSLLQHPDMEYRLSEAKLSNSSLSSTSTASTRRIHGRSQATADIPPADDPRKESSSLSSNGNNPSSRKRRRHHAFPLPFVISVGSDTSATVSSSRQEPSLPKKRATGSWEAPALSQQLSQPHPDQPDWSHLGHLLAALLLTSGLAVMSALDAIQHCLGYVAYTVDDDAVQAVYTENAALVRQTCKSMFRLVVVPTGSGTAAVGLLSYIFVQCQSRHYEGFYSCDGGEYFFHVTRKLAILLVLLCVILGLQLYNMASIMLIPRTLDKNDNPYQSLAAVDRYGHVGDNANLYYLTWMSVGLAIALVYQVATALVRTFRRSRSGQQQLKRGSRFSSSTGDPRLSTSDALLLPATSWEIDLSISSSTSTPRPSWEYLAAHPRETLRRLTSSRVAWSNSLYKLRIRTGIWTAALIACVVIVASCQYVGSQVLWPLAQAHQQHQFGSGTLSSYISVCRSIKESQQRNSDSSNGLPPQFCSRTVAAWLSGVVAAALCATAIFMHLTARYCSKHRPRPVEAEEETSDQLATPISERSVDDDDYHLHGGASLTSWRTTRTAWNRVVAHHPRLPLRTELLLSLLLSILLGYNAVFCTGVQGPAATVGNLYYASWLAFLLCVRIGLGCLEEFYNLDDDDAEKKKKNTPVNNLNKDGGGEIPGMGGTMSHHETPETIETAGSYHAPVLNNDLAPITVDPPVPPPVPASPRKHSIGGDSNESESCSSSGSDLVEKARLGHVRSYFFLGIFSVICASSAYDAASNQKSDWTKPQLYMMVAPFFVAVQSVVLFGLCLSRNCYGWASSFCCGGLCSIVSFGLWLGNLVLTMHSEDSWAVNGIGEIEMANLYYFAWASMITAGVQMTSYLKRLLGIKMNDFMSVVWLSIVKVCFVILGAGLHIWHTVSDNCGFDEITSGAVTFCSRTILAIIVALTGMLVGGLVVLVRLIILTCPVLRCRRLQAHVEMLVSLFLVLLFGAAVALITGIGGPGQSVGDLYYSTWLAFWVSLGIFVNCYSELIAEERVQQLNQSYQRQALNDGGIV